jgi:hypothetical protein
LDWVATSAVFFGGGEDDSCWQTDKAVVNGAHDSAKLQALMKDFVSKFVVCPKCSLPETILVSEDKKDVNAETQERSFIQPVLHSFLFFFCTGCEAQVSENLSQVRRMWSQREC